MLSRLHIRDFAIVEELELEFGPGMSVLTGETGAGKSILLDALGLVLGDRADTAVVRPGCSRAEISAEFDITALEDVTAWLAERELDADGECLVRRTVSAEGRSRGYINGQPMPVQALRELGEQLVDIHGQHAHQSLLKRAVQRQFLDDFAGHGALLAETAAAYHRWRDLYDEYERLAGAAADRTARRDLLRYQVAELRELELAPGEVAELEAEHRRLANAHRLLEGAQQAAAVLSEDEGQTVSHLLAGTLSDLQQLAELDGRLEAAASLLGEAEIQVREAASELRHYLADLELDPERLEYLESRLATLQDLARKHQVRPEELPERLEQLAAELTALEGDDDRLSGLADEIDAAEAVYLEKADALGQGRRGAAEGLAAKVSDNMHGLGMPEGRFEVEVSRPEETAYGPSGLDRVEFRVSANPGQPVGPLNKVASGGELSRVSLALQVIAAGQARIPSLIFDEVDVGVGGGVAEMVGRQLRALADGAQVLCVTHQPQVAALGQHHLAVHKATTDGETRAEVVPLAGKQRVEEVARMLGGMEITGQTRSHAKELLEKAQTS